MAALTIAGCSASTLASSGQQLVSPRTVTNSVASNAQSNPELLAINSTTGALEFWPRSSSGGKHPQALSQPGVFDGFGLAAFGSVVAFANQYPAEVIEFNVQTKTERTLPDPYGKPVDIAIGADRSISVADFVSGSSGNVAYYPPGSQRATELSCQFVGDPTQVAVDDEGDIFVNGYSPGQNNAGVVEIPDGPNGPEPKNCFRLNLRAEGGPAGLIVDPKTDDLVTLDNPGGCAGGINGRMTIYPKPYERRTGITHHVGINCSLGLRLNADSTVVFVVDTDFSLGNSFVLQRTFPDGIPMGRYEGGEPSSITTIPNTLPD